MHADPTADVDRTSLAIAQKLDIQFAAYLTDGTLLAGLLETLARRGYTPTITYSRSPHGDRWLCIIPKPGEPQSYPVEHTDLTRAVVHAAVTALEVDLWRQH